MPNWNQNSLCVSGHKDGIDRLMENRTLYRDEDGEHYLLSSFIPRPKIYDDYDTTRYPDGKGLVIGEKFVNKSDDSETVITGELIVAFKNATKEQSEKYGAIGWYDWNVKNWGTKWDCPIWYKRADDNTAEFDCRTADGSIYDFCLTLSKRFPDLLFTLDISFEYSNSFSLQIKNGEKIKEELTFDCMHSMFCEESDREDVEKTLLGSGFSIGDINDLYDESRFSENYEKNHQMMDIYCQASRYRTFCNEVDREDVEKTLLDSGYSIGDISDFYDESKFRNNSDKNLKMIDSFYQTQSANNSDEDSDDLPF